MHDVVWGQEEHPPCKNTASFIMTVLSKFSSVAGARSLDAASTSTLGCTGPTEIRPNNPDLGGRRDPVRSTRPVASAAGSDKLHKRQKTQVFDKEFWAAKNSYKEAKKNAKRVVWVHKQIASRAKFADVDLKGPEIHRMAKQMRRDNQDVCSEMPVRNNEGVLCLGDEERMG